MKVLYILFLLLLVSFNSFAQDLIYTSDGQSVRGKITDITANKVSYSGQAGDGQSFNLTQVLFVVNGSGDYLVLNGIQAKEEDRKSFLNATTKLPSNVIVQRSGDIIMAENISENDQDIVYSNDGANKSIKKSDAAALFTKNGAHQLYMGADLAIYPLKIAKPKIATMLSFQSENKGAAIIDNSSTEIVGEEIIKSSDLNVDMELFSKKALQKTEEFSTYLQTITAVNTSRDRAMKSIDQACKLFLNEEARVEVSTTNSEVKNKYKIRDYLNRLQFRSGQYDKIIIEYAQINYASEFKKGTDGNYYGVVTFVQKFRGFVDGNVVYGDITKRNMTVVLKHYEKAVDGSVQATWDVFLADLGVLETKKL